MSIGFGRVDCLSVERRMQRANVWMIERWIGESNSRDKSIIRTLEVGHSRASVIDDQMWINIAMFIRRMILVVVIVVAHVDILFVWEILLLERD